MTLNPGTRLGPYEIVSHAGSGGMGDVYKARDTRLNRTVAIKVLPRQLAANPDFRARFEREARAVSSLDHPNICVLHDVGHTDSTGGEQGVEYLVMQFLEGETLAKRISRGPLPLAETLRISTEIASALDKAHRAGILHRDLKPGNVMLTKTGSKLLDFGLAKYSPVAEAAAHTIPATATSPLTGKGTILGTLLYMSPEQLEGRELDARSDIFSFGAMLYEMLTGVRPFGGQSQASVIAAILDREPESLAALAPTTPPTLDRVVRKCLAKDPDRRWQSAGDLCDELSWIAQESGARPAVVPARGPSPARSWIAPVVGILLALTALTVAGVSAWRRLQSPPPVVGRYLTIVPGVAQLTRGGIAVSPDGKYLAYLGTVSEAAVTGPAAPRRIYLQRSDAESATAIAGTEGASSPFFSPDGLWIGYFIETGLMKVSVLGGAPIKISDAPPVNRGGTWGPDDTILFAPTQSNVLHRVSASGGGFGPVTKSTQAQIWPELLPGGKTVLFTRRQGPSRNPENSDLALLDLASGADRTVVQGGAYGRYSPTGHILFMRGDALHAVPFDLKTLQTIGSPLPIVDNIAIDTATGAAQYAVAPDGTLYVVRGAFAASNVSAVWVDRSGKQVGRPLASASRLSGTRLSPDGRRALLTGPTTQGDMDIYMVDVASGSMVRFSGDAADDFNAIWTLDAKSVIYTSFAVARLPTLVSKPGDGTGKAEALVKLNGPQFTGSVSSAGVLAFTTFVAMATRADVYTVALTGEDRTPRPFLYTSADEFGPEFSPDGKWLAYVSTESGVRDVYVVPYPGPGPPRKISSGGASPVWCRTCDELFYQSAAGVMAVAVKAGAFGTPRLLFEAQSFHRASREDGPRQYDVTADGQRFLMLRDDVLNPTSTARLDVIIDWPARLRQRAESGR